MYDIKVVEQLRSLAVVPNESEVISYQQQSENDYDKVGYKHWNWSELHTKALEKIFDMLFYRNYAKHIADVSFIK